MVVVVVIFVYVVDDKTDIYFLCKIILCSHFDFALSKAGLTQLIHEREVEKNTRDVFLESSVSE